MPEKFDQNRYTKERAETEAQKMRELAGENPTAKRYSEVEVKAEAMTNLEYLANESKSPKKSMVRVLTENAIKRGNYKEAKKWVDEYSRKVGSRIESSYGKKHQKSKTPLEWINEVRKELKRILE